MKRVLVVGGAALILLVAMPALFVVLLWLTGGAGGGIPAGAVTVAGAAALWWLFGRRRSRRRRIVLAVPAVLAGLLIVWLCVPVASTQRRFPPPSAVAQKQYWQLPTGSRLAFWHLPPAPGSTPQGDPVVLVHGGPGGYAGEPNRRFLAGLAADGFDVWVYDQAGGGDSDLLPETAYSHDRNVADFAAVLDEIGAPKVRVISQSYGAMIVASALADPDLRGRISQAVFAEPGAYDYSVMARYTPDELYGGARPDASARARAQGNPWDSAMAQPRVILGLLLPAGNRYLGQDEAANAFAGYDLRLQAAGSRCDTADLTASEDRFPVGLNLKANYRINNEGMSEGRSLKAGLAGSEVPIMVMLGECSYVGRAYQTALVTDYPNVARVQYLTGVGHALWDGVPAHDAAARRSLVEFFRDQPPTIPNYPVKADVPGFLAERR